MPERIITVLFLLRVHRVYKEESEGGKFANGVLALRNKIICLHLSMLARTMLCMSPGHACRHSHMQHWGPPFCTSSVGVPGPD